MGVRAAQHRHVHRATRVHVVGKLALPGNQARVFLALYPGANHFLHQGPTPQ